MNWNEIWPAPRKKLSERRLHGILQCSVNMHTVDILFLTSCSCKLRFVAVFKKVKTATSDKIYNSSYPLSFFFLAHSSTKEVGKSDTLDT